jgi:hypothetical protein
MKSVFQAKSLLRADVLVGLAMLPIGGAIAAEGLALGYHDRFGTMGAGFFPFWVGAAMAVGGPVMASLALISEKNGDGSGAEKPNFEQLRAAGLLLAYGGAINIVGFYLASAAYFIAALGFVAKLRWPVVLLVTAVSCFLLWLCVEHWLMIPLPRGRFERF